MLRILCSCVYKRKKAEFMFKIENLLKCSDVLCCYIQIPPFKLFVYSFYFSFTLFSLDLPSAENGGERGEKAVSSVLFSSAANSEISTMDSAEEVAA